MAWNPDVYNQFKTERSAPFYDLLALLKTESGLEVIDLGCGTGELTAKLAEKLPQSNVLGVDSSAEMLGKSVQGGGSTLRFECIPTEEQLKKEQEWDVVFSNAALQWLPDHESLFPRIISRVRSGGQLLVQMPDQPHNATNRLLAELAGKSPYTDAYQGWNRTSHVLTIDRYAEILFECGCKSMQVFEKVYPLILNDIDALVTWVSGTALLPYLERLPEPLKEPFLNDYRALLHEYFPKRPVFYAFKRILMKAEF
jgi:trans-aconitate 2-methyltransferase